MNKYYLQTSVRPYFSMTSLILACALLFGTLSVGAGEVTLPYYGNAEFTPQWLDLESKELESFHRIPEFSFTDQDGQEITEKDVSNSMYVANFFFSTCPGICPMLRSRLSMVQEHFSTDDSVKIISHSIRPSTDTVEVLQAYAKNNGVVSGKWHLLTGDRDKIYELARVAYFADEDLGDPSKLETFLHTENLLLIDRNRHIRGIYNGRSKSSVKNLIADIEILKAERKTD